MLSVTSQTNHIWKWIVSLYPYMANSSRHKSPAFHARILITELSQDERIAQCPILKIIPHVFVNKMFAKVNDVLLKNVHGAFLYVLTTQLKLLN